MKVIPIGSPASCPAGTVMSGKPETAAASDELMKYSKWPLRSPSFGLELFGHAGLFVRATIASRWLESISWLIAAWLGGVVFARACAQGPAWSRPFVASASWKMTSFHGPSRLG